MKCLKKQKVILAVLLLLLTSLLAISGSMPIIKTVETFFEVDSHEHCHTHVHCHKNGDKPHHHSFDFKGPGSTSQDIPIPQKNERQICGGELGLGDIQSVTASISTHGTSPENLFNNVVGIHTTGWHTSSGPQYLQIRFVNKRKISTVSMIPRQKPFSSQFPKEFSIYGSNTVNPSSVYDINDMNLLFHTDGEGYSQPRDTYNTSLTAQQNIAYAVPFNIPESNQEEYYYYTFKFDSSWKDKWAAVFTEMFLYETN